MADLGTVSVGSGTLTIQAGGAVTQSGVITQSAGGGAVSVTAGANAITLADSSNNFTGAVSLSNSGANNVSLRDTDTVTLGTVSIGGLLTVTAGGATTINGTVTAGSGITVTGGGSGAITASGTSTLDGGTGTVTIGAVSHGANDVTITADDVALSGNWTGTGIRTLQPSTSSRTLGLAGGAGNFALSTTELGYLSNASPSSVVIGKSGGTGAITASSFSFDDALTLRGGAVSLGGGTYGALTISGAGAITQTGAVTVTGATSLTAGSANDITLDNTSNSFGGSVAIPSAKDVILKASTSPTMGAYTVSKLTVNGSQVYPALASTTTTTGTTTATINTIANNQVLIASAPLAMFGGASSAPAQSSFATRPLGSGYAVDVFNSDFKVVSISPEMNDVMPNANAATPSMWGGGPSGTPGGKVLSSVNSPELAAATKGAGGDGEDRRRAP